MKKVIFFILFMVIAASSFAFEFPNRSIYVEGIADDPGHEIYFISNFITEAAALGFTVANYRGDAGFILRFNSRRYTDEYDPSINYNVSVYLIDKETDMEVVSLRLAYAALEDMYEFNQFLVYRP